MKIWPFSKHDTKAEQRETLARQQLSADLAREAFRRQLQLLQEATIARQTRSEK